MHKSLFTLLLVSCTFLLSAQRSATEIAVRGLFENQDNIVWFRYYKGRIDDLNDISISLAFDGQSCKGFLTYLRSRERFQLDGTLTGDNQLRAKELDKAGLISGYFNGEIKEGLLKADWNNYNNSIGGNVTLQEVEQEPRLPSYCGDDKWIRQYEGLMKDQAFTLILQKTNNDLIKGVAYTQAGSYNITGSINENRQLHLDLKDTQNKSIGSLQGDHTNDYHLRASFVNAKGETSALTFRMLQQLDMGCIEYADYITSYDITYPKTKNAGFNQWMDKQAMNWVVTCRNRVQKVKTSNLSKKPYLRATERAYAWTDIVYLSEDLLSGYVNFSNTWSSKDRTQMINFDLNRGKSLTTEDILKGSYKKFIRNQIKKEFKQSRYYDLPDFRKWIMKEGYTLFSIRQEGLYFSTKFNTVYGQQHVLIPFGKMKPYLRKNTVVWKTAFE